MAPMQVGAYKPFFVGASDRVAAIPVLPRGVEPAPNRQPMVGATAEMDVDRVPSRPLAGGSYAALTKTLHERFSAFQAQAKHIEETLKVTHAPLRSGLAEELLEQYSTDVAADMRRTRDELQRGKWDISNTVRADYDALCVCLAVWELAHEVAVSSAPSAPRVLHWYNRHYLQDDIAEWWQGAKQLAEDPSAREADSPFWEHVCRLALSDCREEVLLLLQRSLDRVDEHFGRVCEFLRHVPSLRQMDEARASEAEQRQAVHEVQAAARELLREVPAGHPTRGLLAVYAGCTQDAYEAGRDIAAKKGRTWVEDFAYSHAWAFPDLRRSELADLLRAVARRHPAESIDDIDQVLLAVVALDVPALLRLFRDMPDRFPAVFVAHLVDVLYFAGRVPTTFELQGEELTPPRDWHLIAYAQELCCGPRTHRRFAVDYLRAGGSPAAKRFLEWAADQYCAAATSDDEIEESLEVLADLGLSEGVGTKLCRRLAQDAKSRGDVRSCLKWACRVQGPSAPAAAYVSELLDELANENLQALLDALTPEDLSEPLEQYPPNSLLSLLAPARAGACGESVLAPSGRLYFLTQYARCRARRLTGQPASAYAPALVRLLAMGVAAPGLARAVVEEELLPALTAVQEKPALSASEAVALMRYVQSVASDPFRRVKLEVDSDELQRVLGSCVSRAILQVSA